MAYAGELFELSYQAPQTGVRWNDTTVTRPRAHVMWILRPIAVGGEPIAYRYRASADGCKAPGITEAGQPLGATRTLVTWIFRAIAGGYPLRVGTVPAHCGT